MRAVLFGFALLLGSCGPRTDEVVVYTSVDDLYAREIFAAFTKETGVRVLPVFDTEEAKTLGLVHRILAEKVAITPEMAVRLGKFCGNGPGLWLRMQGAYDLWHAETALAEEIKTIRRFRVAA